LRLAKEVLAAGGSGGTVLNAANEVAVAAFFDKRLGFLAIAGVVEATLAACPDLIGLEPQTADDVLEIDEETRRRASGWLPRFA